MKLPGPPALMGVLREMRLQLPSGGSDPITCLPSTNPLAAQADAAIFTVAVLIDIVRTFDSYMGLAGEPAEAGSLNPIRDLRAKAQEALQRVDGGVA